MKVAVALTLGLLVAGAVVAAGKDDAFLIDKRDFAKKYKTIALVPVDGDPLLQMPASVAVVLEEVVTTRLQKRGYTVIPSTVLAGIRQNMEAQVNGFNDPETGRIDAAKVEAVQRHAFRELWFRHEFDALATIRVSVTRVPVENDEVEWDGVRQKIEYTGRRSNYTAVVAASSVSVAFYDSTDKPLYVYYGGLEPLMYRDSDQLLAYTPDRFFLDEKRIRKAAEIAVDPL